MQKENQLSKVGEMPGNTRLTEILSNNRINWGNYKFQSEHLEPIPKIDEKIAAEAKEMLRSLNATMIPCSTAELSTELYVLQGHYWQQGMPSDLMKAVAADYTRLLCGYPLAVVKQACDYWKLSDSAFPPRLGQLKKIMDDVRSKHEHVIRRLAALIENYHNVKTVLK